MRSRCSRPADYLGGHTHTVDVTLDGAHAAGRHRLSRLQRPHVSAADRALRRARRGERGERDVVLGRIDGAGTRVVRHQPARAVRAAAQCAVGRTSGGCSPTSCASIAKRPPWRRATPCLVDLARRVPRPRTIFARLPRLVPAADGRGDLVVAEEGHPRFSAAGRSCASATTTACCRSPTGRSGARSPAARAPTSSRSPRALPDVRLATPVTRIRRSPHGVDDRRTRAARERFDEVVLACHSDQARALLADRVAARARPARARALPAQSRRAAHRHRAAAARAPRVVGVELSRVPTIPTATRPVAGQLSHQQAAAAAVRDAGDRDAQSAVRARARARAAGIRVLRIRCWTAPPSPRSAASRSCRASAARGSPARGWATAFTRTASRPRTPSPTASRERRLARTGCAVERAAA